MYGMVDEGWIFGIGLGVGFGVKTCITACWTYRQNSLSANIFKIKINLTTLNQKSGKYYIEHFTLKRISKIINTKKWDCSMNNILIVKHVNYLIFTSNFIDWFDVVIFIILRFNEDNIVYPMSVFKLINKRHTYLSYLRH